MSSTQSASSPTLVILAAGMGSRYGGLKQMDPIGPNGEFIIDYSIFDAIRAGFGELVFVIRREFEDVFKEKITNRIASRIPVKFVYQELDALPAGFSVPAGRNKPWGTGHAILVSKDAVQTPFAVINADDFYGAASFKAMGDYLRTAADRDGVGDYSMVGFILENTLSEFGHVSRGVCQLDAEQRLEGVVERSQITRDAQGVNYIDEQGQRVALSGQEIVSMNLWGFTPSLFARLERDFIAFLTARGQEAKSEFYIPSVVNAMVAEGAARVKVLLSGDQWFGVTYKEDKPTVVKRIQGLVDQGLYPAQLWG